MKLNKVISTLSALALASALLSACQNNSNVKSGNDQQKNVETANAFIDAFYSFDPSQLKALLQQAEKSRSPILYYQGWAEGGNYEIMERHPCVATKDSLVVCPVTVKDDLIGALEIDFNVTDTFHIIIGNGQILSINTSSNDPPEYYEARDWVRQNRPELIEIPCQGIWDDGSTPGGCVQAMVQGYREFMAAKKSNE